MSRVPISEASGFGVMHVDPNNYVLSFIEKPKTPRDAGETECSLASMGIYVFNTPFLVDQLRRDAVDPNSSHDFGKDIIPYIVRHGNAVHIISRDPACAPTERERVTGVTSERSTPIVRQPRSHRRNPQLDLYDRNWPIWTFAENLPPAKFVHDEKAAGQAVASLVSDGCIVSEQRSGNRSCLPVSISIPTHPSKIP